MRKFLAALLAVFAIHALTPGGLAPQAQAQIIAGQPAAVMLRKSDAYPGATVALDFASVAGKGQFYKANGVISPTFAGLPGLTVTRASGGYAEDASGNLVWFPAGAARITNKGLLVEESRTNLLKWSQDVSNAAWSPTNVTVATTATIAPDGTLTGNKITATSTGTATRQFGQNITKAASAITYTETFYAKAAEYSWVQLTLYDGSAVFDRQWFNISTGALGTHLTGGGGFTGFSASITPSANGWFKCVVTITSNTTTALQSFYYVTSADAAFLNTTLTAGSGIYWWQSDLQAGSFITSPIPTTSATVTRAADDIRLAGMSFLNGMTGLVDAISSGPISSGRFLFHHGTGQPAFFIPASTTSTKVSIGDIADGAATTNAAVGQFRVAGSFISGTELSSANGVTGGSLSTAYTAAATTLYIGQTYVQAQPYNGYIRALALYPTALSQTQLNALTSGVDPSTLRLDFAAGSYKNAAGYVRTNVVRNSAMAGATSSTLPTNWTATGAFGITPQVVGTGTENGLNYVDIRYAGTPNATNSFGTSWDGFSQNSGVAQGQTWTQALSLKLVAGSMANLTAALVINENNSSSAFQSAGSTAVVPTATAARFWLTRTLASATTAGIYGTFDLSVTNGQPFDATIRFYAPQLEQTNYPTSFIATTSGPVSVTTYRSTNPADVGNLSFTRASTAYGTDSQGNLIAFPANVPVITNRGLEVYEQRTNLFLNSFAPATQTITLGATGSYTTTVWGSGSVTVAAGTATLTGGGSASAGSPRTISVTGAGTITVTVSGSPTAVQVEAGAFGTSIISTAGTSATRAADVAYYAYSQGAIGTMAVTYSRAVGTATRGLMALTDGTGNNRIDLRDFGAGHNFTSFGTNASAGQWSFSGGSANDNTGGSMALSFATNAVTGAMDGSVMGTTATATIPTTTQLYIGSVDSGVSQANEAISRVALYGYAANSNETLYRANGSF